jgi:ABC-type uncharacterized transport system fused permease/ATPase subunit
MKYSRGLWPAKEGVIEFPFIDNISNDETLLNMNHAIYYLPQKPFLSDNGSLRQLLSYPSQANNSIAETQWIVEKLNK